MQSRLGQQATHRESIWAGAYAAVTIGAVTLIFLAALQSLAVTTIMPTISDALDGHALYALAFAGTLATGVIGMVVAGAWSDRAGPVMPLTAAVGALVVGLVISGLASSMPVFVLGRLVQGLAAGAQTVALYVIVARVFPPSLHGKVFAAFASAWVVPSIIGPFLAGLVSDLVGWQWVFLGVAVLAIAAFSVLAPHLRGIKKSDAAAPTSRVGLRIVLATVVAISILAIGMLSDLPTGQGWAIAVVCLVVLGLGIRPLLPVGTLLVRRGLPSVVLMRGLVSGAFFGAEVYVPYVLQSQHGFTATTSGLALTAAAISWVVASNLQGRFGDRWGSTRITLIALPLACFALASAVLVSLGTLPPVALIVGWFVGGFGMGLVYPRLTVLTLAYSGPSNQGFNSAALSISDSAGAAIAIALAGLCFVSLGSGAIAYAAVFALAVLIALFAFVPGLRLGNANRPEE